MGRELTGSAALTGMKVRELRGAGHGLLDACESFVGTPNAPGHSQYPGFGEAAISAKGQVVIPGLRTYQSWYRNAAPFCMASALNLTGRLEVSWGP